MADAHRRSKQPEQVRRALLDGAARIAAREGVGAVTVQAVAAAAGVTKGGLFHHFPNKQAMLEAVMAELIEWIDHRIDTHLADDPVAYGRFSRAYVRVALDEGMEAGDPWQALGIGVVLDPGLQQLWARWLVGRLALHAATDADPTLEIVRLAADGAWLSFMAETDRTVIANRAALCVRLLDMTRPAAG